MHIGAWFDTVIAAISNCVKRRIQLVVSVACLYIDVVVLCRRVIALITIYFENSLWDGGQLLECLGWTQNTLKSTDNKANQQKVMQ